MPGKRKTIQQLKLYAGYRSMGDSQEKAGAKAALSLSAAKRLEKNGIRKSNQGCRTVPDPFNSVWDSEVIPLLTNKPTLSAITLLEYLQDKYPAQYPDKLIRTMQRRVKQWRALHGPDKEIMFTQVHEAGLLGLSDFTTLKAVKITINNSPFNHILYHFRLAYSGWSYIKIIYGGESFTALAENFQNALWRLGGAPKEHRTDSLSAAFKNLTKDQKIDLTKKYSELCEHYGIKPTRNNLGCKHENGSIESSHGHMKRRIKQGLEIRDSCDFKTVDEYQRFIDNIVQKHNKRNTETIKYERRFLLELPSIKTCDYTIITALVASTSTIRVKNVVYSVPSKLIGENLRIHLYDERLECYLGANFLFKYSRIRTVHKKIKRSINYKHLLPSLIKKPGAFARSALKEDILPNQDYIEIWKYLESKCERQQACKIIVGILEIASISDKEIEVAEYVKNIINSNKIPYLELLRKEFCLSKKHSEVLSISVKQHDLQSYNILLSNEEYTNESNR